MQVPIVINNGLHQETDWSTFSNYAKVVVSSNAATAGTTLTVQNLDAGVLVRTSTVGAGFADTLPTGAVMEAYQKFADMDIGSSYVLEYSNQVGYAATLTAAASGFTVTGNSSGVVAANVKRTCLITKLAASSYNLNLL